MSAPARCHHPVYRASSNTIASADQYQAVLVIPGAHLGWKYAIRVNGAGLDVRVVARGQAGDEVLDSLVLVATGETRRFSAIPETIGATELIIEAKLTAAGGERNCAAETSWLRVE